MPIRFEDTSDLIRWPSTRDASDEVALEEITSFIDERIRAFAGHLSVNVEADDVEYFVVSLDRYSNLNERWRDLITHQYRLAGWEYVELRKSGDRYQLALGFWLRALTVELVDGTPVRERVAREEDIDHAVQRVLRTGVRRPVVNGWAYESPQQIARVIAPVVLS
jgi:hypothetical protein